MPGKLNHPAQKLQIFCGYSAGRTWGHPLSCTQKNKVHEKITVPFNIAYSNTFVGLP